MAKYWDYPKSTVIFNTACTNFGGRGVSVWKQAEYLQHNLWFCFHWHKYWHFWKLSLEMIWGKAAFLAHWMSCFPNLLVAPVTVDIYTAFYKEKVSYVFHYWSGCAFEWMVLFTMEAVIFLCKISHMIHRPLEMLVTSTASCVGNVVLWINPSQQPSPISTPAGWGREWEG